MRKKEKESLNKSSVSVEKILRSSDGTSAKIIQITNKEGFTTIESGRYEVEGESIVCLSTQIGCAMSCQFCRSTEPFEFYPGEPKRVLRNLIAIEIIDQAENSLEAVPPPSTSKGIVFSYTGMGEPFANITEVRKSIDVLGKRYPTARATISTIGFNFSEIKKIADDIAAGVFPIKIKLHISLHSPDDTKRKQIIPYAKPLAETIETAELFASTTGTEVKLNYVLVSQQNNTREDAENLAQLLKGRRGLVLKISDLNSEDDKKVVPDNQAGEFEIWLKQLGVLTTRFSSKGRDIKAGCGELVKGKTKTVSQTKT